MLGSHSVVNGQEEASKNLGKGCSHSKLSISGDRR